MTQRRPCVDVSPDYRKPEAFQKEPGNEDEKKGRQTDEILRLVIQPGWAGDIPAVESQGQCSQTEQGDEVQQERQTLGDRGGESEGELDDHYDDERKNESEKQEQVDETRIKVLKDFSVEYPIHDKGPNPCPHGLGSVILSPDFPKTDAFLEAASEDCQSKKYEKYVERFNHLSMSCPVPASHRGSSGTPGFSVDRRTL